MSGQIRRKISNLIYALRNFLSHGYTVRTIAGSHELYNETKRNFSANRGLFLDHSDKELQPMAFIAIDLVLQQCRLIPPAIKPFFSIELKYAACPVRIVSRVIPAVRIQVAWS